MKFYDVGEIIFEGRVTKKLRKLLQHCSHFLFKKFCLSSKNLDIPEELGAFNKSVCLHRSQTDTHLWLITTEAGSGPAAMVLAAGKGSQQEF